MKDSILEGITGGPYWPFKCLLLILLFVLLFTCSPAVLIKKDLSLPPAYALKAQHPFADTARIAVPQGAGERSHGAKLTPRLVGSFMLWATNKASLHPYLPATIFGLIFLLSGILVSHHITEDRIVGLFTGLLFSGLYATSACFSVNWTPKPYDGIAIGLLGVALLLVKRPWLLSFIAFLSCWTDERAALALWFIAAVIVVWPSMSPQAKRKRYIALGAAVVAYLITRMIMAKALGWASPDIGLIGIDPLLSASVFQLAAWSAFEGGWIVIAYALWLLLQRKSYVHLSLITASLSVAILSSLLVLDVSRSAAFSFPLILASLAILKNGGLSCRELRYITGIAAGIALLAPNFEIITGVAIRWLPSYFAYLFLR